MADDERPPTGPEAKPAILQDSSFVVQEGLAYRFLSRAAIWLNKLWLAALVLLVLWWLLGAFGQQVGCVQAFDPNARGAGANNATARDDAGWSQQCSVFLNPTSLYLGSMTIVAFVLQIVTGLLGNAVGRNVLEATPAADEVGARRPPGDS